LAGLAGAVTLALVLLPTVAAAQVSVFGFQQYTLGTDLSATGQNVPGRSGEPVPVEVDTTGDVRFGAAITWDVTEAIGVEVMWLRHELEAHVGNGASATRVPLDLDATHYLVHVLYRLSYWRRWTTFLFAGVGATALRSSVTGVEHHGVFDLGVGVSRPLNQRFGVRVQARGAPMPGSHATGRTVYGRGGTGTYAVEPTRGALAAEAFVGLTLAF
jgi:hypothetical protein